MHSNEELLMRAWEGFLGFYFPSCAATREITTKITLQWVHKQFVTRVHTLFYFLHDTTNAQMTIKTGIFTHGPLVSIVRFTLCWWHHNRLPMMSQWPDYRDATTWQVISNSLDVDSRWYLRPVVSEILICFAFFVSHLHFQMLKWCM